jgi:maltodextrin utilization protein YvdJ
MKIAVLNGNGLEEYLHLYRMRKIYISAFNVVKASILSCFQSLCFSGSLSLLSTLTITSKLEGFAIFLRGDFVSL